MNRRHHGTCLMPTSSHAAGARHACCGSARRREGHAHRQTTTHALVKLKQARRRRSARSVQQRNGCRPVSPAHALRSSNRRANGARRAQYGSAMADARATISVTSPAHTAASSASAPGAAPPPSSPPPSSMQAIAGAAQKPIVRAA